MTKKTALFYSFLLIFIATSSVTLLGVIGVIQVKEPYLERLFYALMIELIVAVIASYRKADFFPEDATLTKKQDSRKNFNGKNENSDKNNDLEAIYKNLQAEKFGFKYENVEIETKLNIDGSSISKYSLELMVLNGEVGTREHSVSISGNGNFDNTKYEFKSFSAGHQIHTDYITHSKKSVSLVVRFSPALKKNEKAKYSFTDRNDLGAYSMTCDEVLKQIGNNSYGTLEPYEDDRCFIKFPTDKLKIKVVFPIAFEIKGNDFFDVFVGKSWERSKNEFERLKIMGACTVNKISQEKVIEFSVPFPEVGLCYAVKWIPPSNEEYQKIINGN